MFQSASGAHNGDVYRGIIYLFVTFFLGFFYFSFLMIMFSLALPLMLVWIGFPLLIFTFAAARGMAAFDRQISAAILNVEAPPLPDDLRLTGGTMMQTLSAYAGSAQTWSSIGYLLLKFFLGTLTVSVASILLPFFILEVLLAMVGVRTGLITGQIGLATAHALAGLGTTLIGDQPVWVQVEKLKRTEPDKPKRGDSLEDDDLVHFIGDDGEIDIQRRQS